MISKINRIKRIRTQIVLDWWNDLPIQNLQDMSDSWVGYVWKYYPNREGIYGLTDEEIIYIWKYEFKKNIYK